MDDILIFLHIAKTGGTTLGNILSGLYPVSQQMSSHVGRTASALGVWPPDAFGQAWAALDPQRKTEIRHIAGHSLFGLHRVVDRPCRYVGMVRDPIDRVASSFYYIATQPGIPVYQNISQGLTLAGYIDSKLGLDPHNYQTRILSGDERYNATWDRVGEALDQSMPESALQVAKGNVSNYFSVLGPMEQFDKVLMLLKLKFGFPLRSLLYEQKNVNRERPRSGSLDGDTVEAIRRANALDIELYQFVLDRFAAECELHGEFLDDLVEKFQALLVPFRQLSAMPKEYGLEGVEIKCSELDRICAQAAAVEKRSFE